MKPLINPKIVAYWFAFLFLLPVVSISGLYVYAKFFRGPGPTLEEELQHRVEVFQACKESWLGVVDIVNKYPVDIYFEVSYKNRDKKPLGFWDKDGNDVDSKMPYRGIRTELSHYFGGCPSFQMLQYYDGMFMFMNGGDVLYSTDSIENICNRLGITDYCEYPILPKENEKWMCKVADNFYLLSYHQKNLCVIFEETIRN